jgi:hypothetical protein
VLHPRRRPAHRPLPGNPARYNRVVKKLGLIAAALLLASCSRDIQNTEAVRQGVVNYLRTRTGQTGLDVNQMQIDVVSVSFQKDQAYATMSFRPKSGGEGMQLNYTLERKGNQWVVKGRTESGANPHGAGGLPSLAPQLPPGHPTITPGATPPAAAPGAASPGGAPSGTKK